MTTWIQHSRDEWHSEESGYGIAAWPTGWAVYEKDVVKVRLRGTAVVEDDARNRATVAARALRALQVVLRHCDGQMEEV